MLASRNAQYNRDQVTALSEWQIAMNWETVIAMNILANSQILYVAT